MKKKVFFIFGGILFLVPLSLFIVSLYTQSRKPLQVDENTIAYLRTLPKGVLLSSTFQDHYRGKIGKINLSNSIGPEFTVVSSDHKTHQFFLLQQDMAVLKVSQIIDNSPVSIRLADLKIGDTIDILETLDLLPRTAQYVKAVVIRKL